MGFALALPLQQLHCQVHYWALVEVLAVVRVVVPAEVEVQPVVEAQVELESKSFQNQNQASWGRQ